LNKKEKMEELLAAYVAQKGYQVGKGGQEIVGADTVKNTQILEALAKQLGLNSDSYATNHVLFHGVMRSDPSAYERAYSKLVHWIYNSLEMYKVFLFRFCWK